MIQKLMKRVSDLEHRVRSLEFESTDRLIKETDELLNRGDTIISNGNEDVLSFPDYPQAAAYVPFQIFGGSGTDTISFSLNDDG